MKDIFSFPPISNERARILILGSMPGRDSLRQQRYYAHPRNAFWPIICTSLGSQPAEYQQNTQLVRDRGIAVWDVLQSCQRHGSLDSAIVTSSEKANDFAGFFVAHPHLRQVFFNGAKAEQMYRKRVLPELPAAWQELALTRLPSTSPAHAALRFEQKLQFWREALQAALS